MKYAKDLKNSRPFFKIPAYILSRSFKRNYICACISTKFKQRTVSSVVIQTSGFQF